MSRLIQAAAPLLESQQGVVSRAQLRGLGCSNRRVDVAVDAGLLVPVHPGVYRLRGSTPDSRQMMYAAVLALPGALLSGSSASELYGVRRMPRPGGPELLVTHSSTPELRGVRVRRTRRLCALDRNLVDGLPVVSGARLVVELAPRLGERLLESVVHHLVHERRTTVDDLWDAWVRLRPRRGMDRMRAVLLSMSEDGRAAESDLEVELVAVLRDRRLPTVVRQHPLHIPDFGQIRFDAAWVDWRVGIEADHPYWHGSASAREADERRDDAARSVGWETVRFSDEQIRQHPAEVVRQALARLAVRGYVAPPNP